MSDNGARDAPPINRLDVTKNVLLLYIFAMLLFVLNYIACKLLTDKIIKTINKKYPCQVVLDKIGLNAISYKIPVLWNFAQQNMAKLSKLCQTGIFDNYMLCICAKF